MQSRSVYQFIMSFKKVLICSEYAIEALKVIKSVCLSIARCDVVLQSTSLMTLMLFMQYAIPINCNKTYEDVYECCQLKYLHTKAAASMKQFCTLLGCLLYTSPSPRDLG